MWTTIVAKIAAALFASIGDFFLKREQQQQHDASIQELERLQKANADLALANAQERKRQEVADAVAHLSDTDLLKQLR